ncbi:MAG: hypothetical protein V1738_00460 [Patescibacteria group bacterium]
MWFYRAFGAIIVICLIAIAVIIGRKFSQLILINTEVIPKEKNLARKRQIMDERVRRAANQWSGKIIGWLAPIGAGIRDMFRRQVKRLMTLERQFRNEKVLPPKKKESQFDKLRGEASKLIETEKYGEAEKKLIEALAFDEMNEDIYRALGELYSDMKRWDRARDTFAFLVKLLVRKNCNQSVSDSKGVPVPRFEAFADDCPASKSAHADIAKQYANFAVACSAQEDFAMARAGLEHAVSFEPANPRHLDSLVEACIMEGDKDRAVGSLERLRATNPDNNKLESLQKRIDELAPTEAPAAEKETESAQ